jgi:hypothetical protein
MTTYTLSAKLSESSFIDWTKPSLWAQGSVPDDSSAQVYLNNPAGNFYFVEVAQGEQISIGSLTLQSNALLLYGGLVSAGAVTVGAAATVQIYGGSLGGQSLHLSPSGTDAPTVGIVGVGSVTIAGPIYDQSSIIAGTATGLSDQTSLTVTSGYFQNSGLLEASVGATLTVAITHAGGFANYVSGTLVGGSYDVEDGGTLNLGTNGLIYSLSADLDYGGFGTSTINAFDPSSGAYVSLEKTLSLITAAGLLEVNGGSYSAANSLTVAGELKLLGEADFAASTLYVTGGGHVDLLLAVPWGSGQEISATRVINDGQIFADGSGGGVTVIDAPIQGTGTVWVGPSVTVLDNRMQPETTTATIELTKADSNAIQFSDGTGTVILDSPALVTGRFTGFQAGDRIELPTISLSSVTSYGYANGVLTLHEGSTALHFAFSGSYVTADFMLEVNGAGVALVGVAPAAAA